MSLLALTLIVISAFMHATWNYLAKRSQGGYLFVWLYMMVTLIIFFPFVIGFFTWGDVQIGWVGAAFMAGSGLIHLAYALLLQKGYRIGDFSLIYPVARGTGPLIVAVAAVFIYGETLTPASVFGIGLIAVSIFVLTGGLKAIRQSNTLVPLLYGLLIGVAIASYTLLDKGAVSIIKLPPVLFIYGAVLTQVMILTPLALRNWKDVQYEWRIHRRAAIGVGILNQLAYLLVLTAMTFTQVSYVAPVREISILIGTIIGSKVLSEGFGPRRIIAAASIVSGVIVIATQ